MDVILLDKLSNLGDLGDTVKVKPGFARNCLIPQGKAIPATPSNIAEFESRRAELEKQQADALGAAAARAAALAEVEVSIARKAGDEGKLFGSVGTQDIADAFTEAGQDLKKLEVRLPTGPLRQTGDYDIDVHLHPDVNIQVKVHIVPEG